MMKKTIYLTILLLFIFLGNLNAQLHISSGATIKTIGDVTISLQDIDLDNQGTLDANSNGARILLLENNGTTVQNFGGSGNTQLYHLAVQRNSINAQLTGDVTIHGFLNFNSGKLDLNGNVITLIGLGSVGFENETRRLISSNGGFVTKTRNINGNTFYLSGLGVELSTSSNLGSTVFKRGHRPKTLPAGDDFERYYEIIPTNNSNLDVDAKFHYLDAENPTITETNLELWSYSAQNGWTQQTADNQNVTDDYFEINNVTSFDQTWTLAGNQSVDNDGDGLSLQQGDCDDGNASETIDLTLNNNPIAENYYIVSNQISSAGTIPSNEITTFQAGSEIILQTNFVATSGTDFRAFIVECGVPPAPLNAISENDKIEILSEKETISKAEFDSKNDLQYQVFPNPMSEKGFVNLLLEKETEVEIQLFNNVGKLVKTILSKQIINVGEHQLEYQVNDLVTGIYFVKINLGRKIFTEKVIMMSRQ